MDVEPSINDKLRRILQDRCSEPLNLTPEYLKNITKNFSNELLIGKGGFGQVYKGLLQNGELVAVKKLASYLEPGVKNRQFENEVHHLMGLRHPNIVILLGCCYEAVNQVVEHKGKYISVEKQETLLCLEYIPKGNLCGHLSDESSGLDWDTRYKIIEGICYGLHHLHEECRANSPIIHMDLKPANILLNNNMVPKIADFGMSRLFSDDQTRTCTTNIVGSWGYMVPEYIYNGTITKMSDIFSLGVIIIEIIKGDKNYNDGTGSPSWEPFEAVLNNWRNRLQNSLSYTSLEISCQQIRRCIGIGLACVNSDLSQRPTIRQIINMLHGPESADFSGRKEVYNQWASTSEPPHKYTPLLVNECQSRKRSSTEIDPNCENGRRIKSALKLRYILPDYSPRIKVYIIAVSFLIKISSPGRWANKPYYSKEVYVVLSFWATLE